MLTDTDIALLAHHTEVENAHLMDETLATLTADCVFEDVALGRVLHGHEGAAEYYRMWWEGLDVTVDVERVHIATDGPVVVAETVWRGRHVGTFLGVPATGQEVRIPLVIVARLRDGLLAEEKLYWDRLGVLAQLGIEPAAV